MANTHLINCFTRMHSQNEGDILYDVNGCDAHEKISIPTISCWTRVRPISELVQRLLVLDPAALQHLLAQVLLLEMVVEMSHLISYHVGKISFNNIMTSPPPQPPSPPAPKVAGRLWLASALELPKMSVSLPAPFECNVCIYILCSSKNQI